MNIFARQILSNNQNFRGKGTKISLFPPMNNSVEVSDDHNAPSVCGETTRKLLQGENNILIVIVDD